MSLGKWNELKGSRYDIKADFAAKEYSVTFKKAKMHDAGTYQVFFLTPTQTELDFAHSGGWSLWRPLSFNLPYSDVFLHF